MLAGQSRGKSDKLWMQGGKEWRRGTISPLVTDSSMQTTSPRGRNQEAGPFTQAEEKEVEVHSSVNYGHIRKIWGGGACLQDRLDKWISLPQLDC